ncbi:hypothetical protein ERC79_07420 [Rhodococcus sp. ABRD24]|uniref:hypothetical protein n=1 Tax=Rhodococcus sp. ABRD24 TaxID=2507582 RepID=UPI00104007CC|nr:hypothetical protein [Rhodococcus sp. ABRD24]QBJ95815.1 hypothetical protein ERC79_07420 [Rhodococcus sp. ABRD24]
MISNVRAPLSAVAALLAGALATFVLVSPPEWRGAFSASGRQLESWLDTVPTAIAVATVLAVLAYAALQRAGSVRPAWISAAVASAVLIGVRLMVSGAGGVDQLTLLHYAKCVAAGVLLGATVAAVWTRPLPRLTFVAAVASTFVVAHTADTGWEPSTSTLGEPFWWLLIPVVVLTVACAVVDADAPAKADAALVRNVAAAVVTLALAHRLLGAWIDGQTTDSTLQQWVVIGVCLVLVVALTEFWAQRIESPFLLAATAVAAATALVASQLAQWTRIEPWLAVVVGTTTVVVGLATSMRRPTPSIGLAVLALVPLSTAVDPDFGNEGVWLLVRLAVLGLGIGLTLGSTLPDSGAVASLGLVVPLLALVFTEVVTTTRTVITYNGAYEPLPGVPLSSGYDTLLPPAPNRIAGIALLLVVVFCALAIRGLGARERTEPTD